MDNTFILLDARAGLNDDASEGSVMLAGSAKECCKAANDGDYGEGCVVSDGSVIMWEWFSTGKWIAP